MQKSQGGICRTCTLDFPVVWSMFDEDELWKKIKYFANVKIEEGDSLPQNVCMKCADIVKIAFSFKKKCEEADRFFRKEILKQNVLKDCDVISISSNDDCNKEITEENYTIPDRLKTEIKCIDESNGDPLWIAGQPTDEACDPMIPQIELTTPYDDGDKRSISSHQCSSCFEFFAMKTILKHHVKTVHPETIATYECFDCKKVYYSKRFLKKHVRRGRCVQKRKHQTRPMKCSYCDMTFKSGHHYGWHKRSGRCPNRSGASNNSVREIEPEDSASEDEKADFNESYATEMQNAYYSKLKRNEINKKTKSKHKSERARIHWNNDKIALAERLIAEDAPISKLAKELQISRTYACRLRSGLMKGIKLETTIKAEQKRTDEQIDLEIANEQNAMQKKDGLKIKIKRQPYNDSENEEQEDTESAEECIQDNNVPYSASQPSCSKSSSPLYPSNIHHNETEFKHSLTFKQINNTTKVENSPQAQSSKKKQRKPNVFMTEEKYEKAKKLVEERATTMEIARRLNVSQMSAWKLRDNIIKGKPLTFKKPLIPKPVERPKINVRRPRLKAAERVERDKQIITEILAMINEDNNIQYWRVSEKLADKGFHLSASSVCQRLKALGYHRRTKSLDNQNDSIKQAPSSDGDDDNSNYLGNTDSNHF